MTGQERKVAAMEKRLMQRADRERARDSEPPAPGLPAIIRSLGGGPGIAALLVSLGVGGAGTAAVKTELEALRNDIAMLRGELTEITARQAEHATAVGKLSDAQAADRKTVAQVVRSERSFRSALCEVIRSERVCPGRRRVARASSKHELVPLPNPPE